MSIEYQIKNYLQTNYPDLIPKYWYIYQDINNPLLILYDNQDRIQDINNCYIVNYITEYEGSDTRIYTLIFDISNNSVLNDVLFYSGEDLSNIQDEAQNDIVQSFYYNYYNTP